ncbi:MAG: hypothetical protein U0271_09435 [Polyangiaceae bacterium]
MSRSVFLWVALSGALGTLGCAAPPDTEQMEDADCGACHSRQQSEQADSAHGTSADSPVFNALRPRVEAAWGIGARKRCDACHKPKHSPDEHVSCVSCHDALGNVEPRDGKLIVDLGRPPAGPLGSDGGPHGARPAGFLADAELCLTCHEVTGPVHFVESTAAEYSAFRAGGGEESCIDCHMPALAEGPAADGGPSERSLRDHTFVGLRAAWGADEAARDERAEASRAMLERALTLTAESDNGALRVRFSNSGAGHAVPTGVAALRRIWVRIEFLDERDVVLSAYGDVDADGRVLHESPLVLGVFGEGASGPVTLLVDATSMRSSTLSPGEARDATVPIPTGAMKARVAILARAHTMESLDALGLSVRAPEVPTLVASPLSVSLAD